MFILLATEQIEIRVRQIKTTMKYQLTAVRMAIVKRITNKYWQRYGEKETLIHYWWGCKLETLFNFSKIKIELSHDPEIPLWVFIQRK